MARFGVSIKGVVEHDGKLLLRKNERQEYEFLGGRLEKEDASAADRLITEFREESGVRVRILEQREPWLYEIGLSNIIIVPFVCEPLSIPDQMTDEDGGTLHWVSREDAMRSFMPQGYKDTIAGRIPHKSYSIPPKTFFKKIPGYVPQHYEVEVCVTDGGKELLRIPLPHFHMPRDLLRRHMDTARLVPTPVEIDRDRDTVVLHYMLAE